MHVKICGITRTEDAQLAAALGAAAVGFVFWPESPRFIPPAAAATIVENLPPFVVPVGVFVDHPVEEIVDVAAEVGLGLVQLHGHATPEDARRIGRRVIRALGLAPEQPVPDLDVWPPSTTILVDAHDPVRRGGTGRTMDWHVARTLAARRRLILSGGLRAENVTEAIATVRPYGVDVSSGVERRPGEKDPERLRAFMRAVEHARRNAEGGDDGR